MSAYFFNRNWDKKENERKRVVITGMGTVTPLGNDIKKTWQNLVKGKSGIGHITIFDASKYPVKIGAEVKNFDFDGCVPEDITPFLGRSTKFCIHATKEALQNSELDLENMDTSQVGISLGANEEFANISFFPPCFLTNIYLLFLFLTVQPLSSVDSINSALYLVITESSVIFSI